jgi:hypothetical protein
MTKEQKEVIGNLAMEVIADYPLYASTSGITFDEAIAIASIIQPNLISINKE